MNPFSPSEAIINSQEMGESLEGKSACLGFHGRFFIESYCSLSCPGFFFFSFFLKTAARAMNGDDLIHSLGLNIAISD